MTDRDGRRSLVGERHVVQVGRVAHGGHCVARVAGRVVFVRHALPDERVVVELTEGDEGSRFLRGDAVEVLEPSADRVERRCPYSGPGGCGGCDFQHVSLPAQRALKAAVVEEQMARLAGVSVAVTVEPVPGDRDGLDWRTRMQFAVDGRGYAGLRRHRSHEVVPLDDCPISHPDLPPVLTRRWPGSSAVEAITSSSGQQLVLVTRDGETLAEGPVELEERVGDRAFRVTGSGFWQVHPGAPAALLAAVLDGTSPGRGETVADLYAGAGLFSAALAGAVGPDGRVVAVEGNRSAHSDLQRNLADLSQVQTVRDRVDRALDRGSVGSARDIVVLDPPRAGAKRQVVAGVAGLRPRVVAYVACDPASLARDVALFAGHGYALASLRAFDLFPMTQHVECVAILGHRSSLGSPR